MTNLNNLLRRMVALLLCACMMAGYMGSALAAVPNVLSPYVPLMKSTGPRSAGQQRVALSQYAEVSHALTADADDNDLPDTVEDQGAFW